MYFNRIYEHQTDVDHDFLHPLLPLHHSAFQFAMTSKYVSQCLSFLLISESNTNDTKIILIDGVEFVWEKVQGASNYLLRLLENKFLKENSLLGCGTSTSVEIPYSSLSFKSATEKSKKIPLEVVIEVWAYGNAKIIGDGIRYTNVGMYECYTGLSSKRKITSLFYRGKNLCLH